MVSTPAGRLIQRAEPSPVLAREPVGAGLEVLDALSATVGVPDGEGEVVADGVDEVLGLGVIGDVSLIRFDGHLCRGGQAARAVSYSAGLR